MTVKTMFEGWSTHWRVFGTRKRKGQGGKKGGEEGWQWGRDGELQEVVGEGTYRKVYKACNKRTRQLVVLKKTWLDMEEEGVLSMAL
jgi:hypothetical protein